MSVKQHNDAGPAGDFAAARLGAPNSAPNTLRISSERLFAGANEVQIEHRGSLYRLKQTSLGKLILTK